MINFRSAPSSRVRLPNDKIGIKSMIVIKIKLKLAFEGADAGRNSRSWINVIPEG